VHITYQAKAGKVKDWRVRVLIDGNNNLAAAHSCQVLNSPGYSAGNIQVRRDHFAGLTDLVIVLNISGVYCSPTGTNCRAENISQILNQIKSLLSAPSSSRSSGGVRAGLIAVPRPPVTITLASVRLTPEAFS